MPIEHIMSSRTIKICLCCWIVLASAAIAPQVQADMEKGTEYSRIADNFFFAEDFPRAAFNYRLAIAEGVRDPELYRRYAITLYELRLVDEAVANMEEAVRLAPDNPFMLSELGSFYLAAGHLEQAVDYLSRGLRLNPTTGDNFFYLGEAFYRQKKFALASLAAESARKLRYDSRLLIDKIRQAGGPLPQSDAFFAASGKEIAIRRLLLQKEGDVKRFWSQWDKGVSFESLTLQAGIETGGYVGTFAVEELSEPVAKALAGKPPYHRPVAVPVENGTLILQRVLPFSLDNWQRQLAEVKPSVGSEGAELQGDDSSRGQSKGDALEFGDLDQRKIPVFAGTFRNIDNATDLTKALRELGFAAKTYRELKKDEGQFFYVIAGQFDSAAEAQKAAERLHESGYESYIPGH